MRGMLAIVALCAALGCADKPSQRCERVCQREADCAEAVDDETFNKGECVEQCNDLERKREGAELVGRHVECVIQASDCRAVRACH